MHTANLPGETGLSLPYWRSTGKHGGSGSTCPPAPNTQGQPERWSLLAPSTLSTLTSVKQHINQRHVQMSARTSACFKNDQHSSSHLAVWSPHEDTLSGSSAMLESVDTDVWVTRCLANMLGLHNQRCIIMSYQLLFTTRSRTLRWLGTAGACGKPYIHSTLEPNSKKTATAVILRPQKYWI